MMKKIITLTLALTIGLSLPSFNTQAASSLTEDNSVGIGFEGVWTEPEGMMPEVDPAAPETPGIPDVPATPDAPAVPGIPQEPEAPAAPPVLPPTGSASSLLYMVLGLMVMGGAARMLFSRKKQHMTAALGLAAAGTLLGLNGSNVMAADSQQSQGTATFTYSDEMPQPGQPGTLSIEYVTDINFGVMPISNLDQVFYALPYSGYESSVLEVSASDPVENFVRVFDHRPGNTPWQLQARMNGQLQAPAGSEFEVLEGAVLSFVDVRKVANVFQGDFDLWDVEFDPEGSLHQVKTVQPLTQRFVSYAVFGDLLEIEGIMRNTGVQLFVPGATPRGAYQYTTTLTWVLSDVVEN